MAKPAPKLSPDEVKRVIATAFEDEACAALEAAAKSGQCGLLTVELDGRPGDDVPRVTVKRFQPSVELGKKRRAHRQVRDHEPRIRTTPAASREPDHDLPRKDSAGMVVMSRHMRFELFLARRSYNSPGRKTKRTRLSCNSLKCMDKLR